jgi:hypothetical protein
VGRFIFAQAKISDIIRTDAKKPRGVKKRALYIINNAFVSREATFPDGCSPVQIRNLAQGSSSPYAPFMIHLPIPLNPIFLCMSRISQSSATCDEASSSHIK